MQFDSTERSYYVSYLVKIDHTHVLTPWKMQSQPCKGGELQYLLHSSQYRTAHVAANQAITYLFTELFPEFEQASSR